MLMLQVIQDKSGSNNEPGEIAYNPSSVKDQGLANCCG